MVKFVLSIMGTFFNAFSQMVNAVILRGNPNETVSGRAGRIHKWDNPDHTAWVWTRHVLNFVVWWDDDHCLESHMNEVAAAATFLDAHRARIFGDSADGLPSHAPDDTEPEPAPQPEPIVDEAPTPEPDQEPAPLDPPAVVGEDDTPAEPAEKYSKAWCQWYFENVDDGVPTFERTDIVRRCQATGFNAQ